MISVLLIAILFLPSLAEAAKRIARPVIGAPVGISLSGDGHTIDAKDCYFTTPFATAADTESSSGTMISKPAGNRYDGGQIGCPVNVDPQNYFVWVKVRLRGVTQVPERVFWVDAAPFKSSFQNTKATLISDNVSLPPATSFDWRPVGGNLNMATFVQGTAQTSFALGSGSVLYFMGTDVVEFDCIFLHESPSATPICPAGVPASGITHNATGVAAAGSTVSTLQPTITVAAGSDRILFAAVCHRTSTNTISSVSSNVNGVFTLVDWRNNDTVAGAIYRLLNPSTGAHTVTVTFSQAQNGAAGLVAYNGVSQSAPTSAVSGSTGTGNPSTTVAGAADQFAIDHLCVSVDNAETVAVHASQTQRYQKEVDIAGGANRVSAWSDQQGDTSVAMDWTISGTKGWAHQALMIRPPSGAGSPPVLGSPSVTLLGPTSVLIEASVDDPSAQCEAEYDVDSGAPYASNSPDVGATGGKCITTVTGLSQSTVYFFRVNATNAQGTTNGTQGTFDTTIATAVTSLGITQAEINIWNTRRASGPYRNAGDVSSNSPGDFARILASANSMVSSPETTWAGQVPNSCWTSTAPALPGRTRGEKAVNSAFMFLLTGDTSYRTPVLNLLLAQAAVTGTDFSNTTKWSMQFPGCFSTEPGWEILQWLTKLLYAYDYIRHTISAGNKTTIDTWFLNAATYMSNFHHQSVQRHFPNRLSDDYTTYTGPACTGGGPFYHGGPNYIGGFFSMFENTVLSLPWFFGKAGVMLNNSTLKTRATRSFQEWVRFANYSDNTSVEFHRTTTNARSLGWIYAATMIGEMVMLADAFARTGDSSLYEHTTSLGFSTCVAAGGPKSLKGIILNHLQHMNGTITRYMVGHNGDANYRLDSSDAVNNIHSNNDTYFAPANVYYNDAQIKSFYTRTAANAPAYPSNPSSGGYCVYCATWGVLPGVLGMHGGMEGLVDPYP